MGSGRAKCHLRTDITIPCAFCKSNVDNEIEYGPMYTIGNITVHYFCVLLSTKLIQKGKDNEGLLGFLYTDIRNELKWSESKHCTYCKMNGATIFCCHRSCRLLFHLPCGLKRGALTLFHRTFQSFCGKHRVHQTVPSFILSKFRRMVVSLDKISFQQTYGVNDIKEIMQNSERTKKHIKSLTNKMDVCFICYEELIISENMNNTFWPPCCKTIALFHKRCLSRMAISAGKHYIRCPLCNNSSEFVNALLAFGIYIPEQDASWERVNGAFNELLQRPNECMANICICPNGRSINTSTSWKLLICDTCGSEAVHKKCMDLDNELYECHRCIKTDETSNNAPNNEERICFSTNSINALPDEFINNLEENLSLPNKILDDGYSESSQLPPDNNEDTKPFVGKSLIASCDKFDIHLLSDPCPLDHNTTENVEECKTIYENYTPNFINIKKDLFNVNQVEVRNLDNKVTIQKSNLSANDYFELKKKSIMDYFNPPEKNIFERIPCEPSKKNSKKRIKTENIHCSNTLHKYFQKNENQNEKNNFQRKVSMKRSFITKSKIPTDYPTEYSIKRYFQADDNKSKPKRNRIYLKRIKKIKYSVEFTETNSKDVIRTITHTSSVSILKKCTENARSSSNKNVEIKRSKRGHGIPKRLYIEEIGGNENVNDIHSPQLKKIKY